MSPVILIDVSNLVFRSHYAFRNLSSQERPTGVLYGALRTVHDLRESVSRRMIFCWDHGVPLPGAARPRNWRESFLPTYKASRTLRKDDGERQRALIQAPELFRALGYLGYASVSVLGLEADDIIGILASGMKDDVLIFSTDRDLYQLIDSRIQILTPKKERGLFRRITQTEIEIEYGITPKQWAAYLALGGDSSDNIKPKKGMGPKTAIRLVQAGACPGVPFSRQSPTFRAGHQDLVEVWEAIRRSYDAARIPTSWTDPRIASCLPKPSDLQNLNVSPDQYWRNPEIKRHAEENFLRFCAEYEMPFLLSLKRPLFNPGEPPCPQTKHR